MTGVEPVETAAVALGDAAAVASEGATERKCSGPEPPEVRDLADRCEAGCEEAIREFVARYERLLFAISLRMLGDRQDAEDVVQESLVRVLRAIGRWDRDRPLVPWMATIVSNRCRTALKSRSRRAKLTADARQPTVSDDQTAAAVTRSEQRAAIDAAVQTLPEDLREVFVLHYQGGLTCQQIAEQIGRPEGTIKTWLYRARGRLAPKLAHLTAADD